MNLEKIKCIPFMSVSHLHNGQDTRTVGIEYSRGVPKPKVLIGERVLENIPRSQSKDGLTELERLEMNHLKYMEMMQQM
jgi:hypothetical protein